MVVDTNIQEKLLQVAEEALVKGPGFAQEGYVLGEVGKNLDARTDLAKQQRILDAWQDLFVRRLLAWGYDLQNSQAPFFHKPQ